MDQYSKDEELSFIEGLYEEADNKIKEIYKEQKQNRDALLREIANILLVYTIMNDIMSMSKADRKKEYMRIFDIINIFTKKQANITENIITDILKNTVKDTYEFYSYNAKLKDVEKIIKDKFNGKHFSTRVWDNEEEVAKHLHNQVQDFLQGKINVNQIKNSVEKTYNNNAYEVKRLVETEVNRCSNDAFIRFCKETGVKKVKRNEILDKKTCSICAALDGKIYDLDDAPSAIHPLCRGFNTIVD